MSGRASGADDGRPNLAQRTFSRGPRREVSPRPTITPFSRPQAEWVTPTDWLASPDDVSEHEQLVPLYVLDGPLVPGSQHEVNVPAEDAGLVRMFDDLLATGGRRVVTTWGVRDRTGTCLARYGCGMTLEKITDARSESGGRLQWRCAHALGRDRVRIHKVVARGAGDASYLRCVASDAPDAEVAPAVRAGAAVRVRAGKHAGVAGTGGRAESFASLMLRTSRGRHRQSNAAKNQQKRCSSII